MNRSGLFARTLDGVLLDMRFATRMFRRRPGVVSVTVIGLALAIGFSTAVFGLVQAMFLPPIGIDDLSDVVEVERLFDNGRSSSWLYEGRYRQLEAAVSSVRLEAWGKERASFGDTNPEEVRLSVVSGGFFESLGVRAALGRVLTRQDDTPAATPALVITYAFWQRRLGGDENVVGRTVRLMETPFTVVGVLEKGFAGFEPNAPPAFWVPAAIHGQVWRREPPPELVMHVVGRISPGATRTQAEHEVTAVMASIAAGWTRDEREPGTVGARLQPISGPFSGPGGATMRWVIGTILAILGFVLLLACTNVANLLLANAITRRREVGVRLALGAGRARIARQMLTESLMLGAVSGAIGLVFAYWLVPVLDRSLELPAVLDVSPDMRFFLFALVFTLLAGLGAGLAPARYGAQGDLATPLKGAAAGGGQDRPGRTRALLIGVQAAASIVLLVLAALFARSVLYATQFDLGIDVERLAKVTPRLDAAGYDAARAADYWQRVIERVNGLPGVERSALVSHAPFGGSYGRTIHLRGDGREWLAYVIHSSSDYFTTVGLAVRRGRTYTAQEVAGGAPVAVISARLAGELWGAEEPLGSSLERLADDLTETRVIGIVDDAPFRLTELESNMVYLPVEPGGGGGNMLRMELLVRATGSADTILSPLQESVRAMDPEASPRTTTMVQDLEASLQPLRLNLILAAILGGVALGLACTGVFSLTAFAVEQRVGEIGVRMAVGASARDVVRLMVRDSLRPVLAGLFVGFLVALGGTRILTVVLYGVSPYDPLSLAAAVTALLATALLAAVIASRRAAAVDPVVVLEG